MRVLHATTGCERSRSRDFLDSRSTNLQRRTRQQLESRKTTIDTGLLKKATQRLARGQQLIMAKKLMGVYLSEMGPKAEAAEQLSQLANDQPDLLLTLAMLYAEIG